MSDVSATYARGSVVLASRSVTFNPLRLQAPFIRNPAIETGRANLGSKAWHPASRTPTEKGFFTYQVYHPEGTIVALTARATVNGLARAEAAILVRLRADAPPMRVNLSLPIQPNLTILGDSFTVFTGRGDVISPAEARLLGVQIPARWEQANCSREEIDELFDVVQIGQGAPKPILQATTTSDGEVRVVATAERPVRGIRRRS